MERGHWMQKYPGRMESPVRGILVHKPKRWSHGRACSLTSPIGVMSRKLRLVKQDWGLYPPGPPTSVDFSPSRAIAPVCPFQVLLVTAPAPLDLRATQSSHCY